MSKFNKSLPKYQLDQTYDWNYANPPALPEKINIPEIAGQWEYCGLPIASPLAIAAGPLLNGDWIRYYAALGFDLLTYKTVRTRSRDCYPLPNLVPVEAGMMSGTEDQVAASADWEGSWAVSFGMPSKLPSEWQPDVQRTKQALAEHQRLAVSVVGTMQPGWSLEDLAADYGQCAKLAFQAGADCVEMNFSCPNVCSEDGQLFQNPAAAEMVARTAREHVGAGAPLLVKIGYVTEQTLLTSLINSLAAHVDAIVTTNSLPARVTDQNTKLLFDSQQRGICGRASRDASVRQTEAIRKIIDHNGTKLDVIGVGGIETAADVRQYLNAGASSVQLATAVMIDPLVGVKIREEWNA